jgi:hypothetical protein
MNPSDKVAIALSLTIQSVRYKSTRKKTSAIVITKPTLEKSCSFILLSPFQFLIEAKSDIKNEMTLFTETLLARFYKQI